MSITQELSKIFSIDKQRDLLIPDRRFCRLDLTPAINQAKKELLSQNDCDVDSFVELPSWSKSAKFPIKSKAFLVNFFEGIVGISNRVSDTLYIDYQIQSVGMNRRTRYHCQITGNEILVEMMFFSATNSNLEDIGQIYQQTVKKSQLVLLCGRKINGSSFTNANAQARVIKIIQQAALAGKDVMIMAANMGSRSFSIPSLSTVYLCYDKGEEGATRQKMSRALTSDTEDKIGYVVSCSFNPNRDDKLSSEVLTTVQNLKPLHSEKSAKDLLRYILRTESLFFDFSKNGLQMINVDHWLENAHETGMISRIIGSTQNISALSRETMAKWARANGYEVITSEKEKDDSGLTYSVDKPKMSKNSTDNNDDTENESNMNDLMDNVRAAITLFLDKFHILQIGTGSKTASETLEAIRTNQNHQKFLKEYFNIDIQTILDSIDEGGINSISLELALN
jgi:hypothetical protein